MKAPLIVRLIAPVAATSLLLLAVGVGSAWFVHRWQRNVLHELRINVGAMRAAEELEIIVREMRTRLDNYLITGDRKYLREVHPLRAEAERWLREAENCSPTEREQLLMTRVRAGYNRFLAGLHALKDIAHPHLLRPRIRTLIDTILTPEILEPTHSFLDLNEEEVEDSIKGNEAFADRFVYVLLLLGICGSGAGLVAGFGFARGFSRSLVQLSVPIRHAAGQLDEVVGPITFRAGTDLKDLEGVLRQIAERIGAVVERLRQSEREALRAEQLANLGQLAAGMAHELRNPLTSMKILVQGATTGWGDASPGLSERDLTILEEEITRLERLTHSFLDFARPPQTETKVVDVGPLVEQTLRVVAERAGDTRIAYVPAPAPVWAAVDPGQFSQVLLNLLLNALDAVAGAGTVWVELESNGGKSVTLRVSDTGCGIPAALGQRIFAPFTTTKETGLGLGLSICKRIAEAHGGEITAANRPGGGAVFTVRWPPAPK